jgi:hypothetical protein
MGRPGNAALQRRAVEMFHGDERFSVLFANVVNCADVRMIERGSGLRFTLKASQ